LDTIKNEKATLNYVRLFEDIPLINYYLFQQKVISIWHNNVTVTQFKFSPNSN